MPASTSSKTIVAMDSVWARMDFSASTTRDSSPPEAMAASGFSASPTFGAMVNTARSMPLSLTAQAFTVNGRRPAGRPGRGQLDPELGPVHFKRRQLGRDLCHEAFGGFLAFFRQQAGLL